MENCNVIIVRYYNDDNHLIQESSKIFITDKTKIAIDGNFIAVIDEYNNIHIGNRVYFNYDDGITKVKNYIIKTENGAFNINNILFIAAVEDKVIILDDYKDLHTKDYIELTTL